MEEMTNVIECTNDLKADWCVQKIKELREEKDRLVGIVDAEIEELLAKKESIISNTEHEVGYFSTALYKYFEGLENKKDAKTQQSYKLVHGSLVYKKPALKIKTPDKDDAALLIYLKANEPDMVKVEETPKWGDFKKNLTITEDGEVADVRSGEVLSFLKTEESEASFDVKLT